MGVYWVLMQNKAESKGGNGEQVMENKSVRNRDLPLRNFLNFKKKLSEAKIRSSNPKTFRIAWKVIICFKNKFQIC